MYQHLDSSIQKDEYLSRKYVHYETNHRMKAPVPEQWERVIEKTQAKSSLSWDTHQIAEELGWVSFWQEGQQNLSLGD